MRHRLKHNKSKETARPNADYDYSNVKCKTFLLLLTLLSSGASESYCYENNWFCLNDSPAVVATRFADNLDVPAEVRQKALENYKNSQPLGFIKPHQISEGIIFLCTSEMTTGASLPIDGGLMYSNK